MANEIQVRASLQIRVGSQNYQSQPTSFNDDVSASVHAGLGVTPGRLTVPTTGKDVDLSQLTTPGYVWFQNLDDTNRIEWGIRDPGTNRFYPIGELDPGKFTQFKFSRNIMEDYSPPTGTGTSAPVNFFHLKAHGASCIVNVQAFEA